MIKAIICDLDGVLCDHRHRLHFIMNEGDYPKQNDSKLIEKICSPKKWKPDWDAFYEAMDKDTPNEWCVEMIARWAVETYYELGRKVIFVTGRPEKYRPQTTTWLAKNICGCDWSLFMRPDMDRCTICYSSSVDPDSAICGECGSIEDHEDDRPSQEVKKEIYELKIKYEYDVLFVLENDEQCSQMYKEQGLTVLKVM